MNRTIAIIKAGSTLLALLSAAPAQTETSVTLDVASAYVFRGVTLNDGPVVQPGIETSAHGFTLGVWGNLDLGGYNGSLERHQFSEIDLWLTYDIPVGKAILTPGYTEYTYPGSPDGADRELSLAVGLEIPLAPFATIYYGLDGDIRKDLYFEAGAEQAFELADGLSLDLSATVGYLSQDTGQQGFTVYTLGAGVSYGMLTAGLTYYGRIDDQALPRGPGAYDVKVVGMLSLAFEL